MSQEQPQRPRADQEPIKYGDVLPVAGELADKPVAPRDVAMMQNAQNMVLGQTQKGGPAAVMQSAATKNERAGLVAHDQVSDVAGKEGVSLTETDLAGRRIITEAVVGQFVQRTPLVNAEELEVEVQQASITIGEALEATVQTAGYKPVDHSDAAAIQAAEVRATGTNVITPAGLAATAQSAATHNVEMTRDADKVKLGAVLTNATMKLSADKAATRQVAEWVISAELRNNPSLTTHPGGVADSVVAAARLNERTS